jgi:hypothetical protein
MKKKLLIVIATFLVLGFCGIALDPNYHLENLQASACVAAQNYVEKRLVAPSTASFPWRGCTYFEGVDQGEWVLNSYVDAQNRFGAKIRTHYTGTFTIRDGRIVGPVEVHVIGNPND